MTLDDMAEIPSWPIAELDPFYLSVKLQVMRIIFAIGAKAYLDGTLGREAARERDRERVLAAMAGDLRGQEAVVARIGRMPGQKGVHQKYAMGSPPKTGQIVCCQTRTYHLLRTRSRCSVAFLDLSCLSR
jgi:hypothetical protein